MLETPHASAPARARSILALSLLALLAFCCLPVLAQASSGGAQYQDAAPSAPGGSPSKDDLSGGSTSGIGSAAGSKGKNGGKGSSSTAGGKNGGGPESSQGTGEIGAGQALGDENAAGAAPGTDSGGSSPLVPILIAILLLAGGSVAYVMYKRRRAAPGDPSDPSSTISPEAG